VSAVATIFRIAFHVFKDSVRDKVLYAIVLFAVLMIGASMLLSQTSGGQDVKIIKDLGLAAISIFGLFAAIFIGIGLVSKEVERRSIYGLLVKPMTRPQFVLGKFCGLVLTLAVNVTVMTLALFAVLLYYQWALPEMARKALEAPAVDPALLKATFLILVELVVVTAVALFFSTFAGPIVSAALTFGAVIIGNFNADLKNFESVVDSTPMIWLAKVLYYALPNLAPFDVKAQVVHAQPVPLGYIGLSVGYAGLYVGMLLLLTTLIFSRRDFK
jgi:ABC-type transport system involved in multi-copper enzyme maturation permease subunit